MLDGESTNPENFASVTWDLISEHFDEDGWLPGNEPTEPPTLPPQEEQVEENTNEIDDESDNIPDPEEDFADEFDSDDDDFDEMNDYDELKNSFNEPNNEPINESISETNQINENDRKPSFDFEGDINEDGWEICEYPRGSNIWWWKDYENESWILWE